MFLDAKTLTVMQYLICRARTDFSYATLEWYPSVLSLQAGNMEEKGLTGGEKMQLALIFSYYNLETEGWL